ncbi:hypothetical protein [Streptomyces sp. TRM68416]|uniref:hypothetical protein n=1 Tax=Streptomyces sp. TRM68416 TaxID=2758412 RepID=UPI0016621319|nr:hypothetical protein [Streptomyces sp. TRM68416]MBD0842211.1 hypothetical protein [Streptomyces sp. TRM68416]
MPLPPARVLTASALALGALLTASACSAGGRPEASAPVKSPVASPTPTPSSAPPSPTAAPALTEAQARAALITAADLGEPWSETQGAATWRDGMLKASTDDPDCRRLLDSLYAEEFFGGDARTGAVTGLDDDWDEAQIRYQVVVHPPAEVDRTLAWLGTLPQKCGRFTAVTGTGTREEVEVTEAELPEVGDARQGLRVTLTAATDDAPTLTLELAAVRVGEDTILLTNGSLADLPTDATWTATELGAARLAEVRKQGRAEV